MVTMRFDREAYASSNSAFSEIKIWIRIADIELLGLEEAEDDPIQAGLRLWVPDIARHGLLALYRAKQYGYADFDIGCEFGEMLIFKMVGDTVLVHSTIREKTVQVSYERLEQAWIGFASQARAFLSTHFATLAENDYWSSWLRGDPEAILEPRPEDPAWFQSHDYFFARIDGTER
ncbi:MAG TPA: hypothetical protein VIL85_19335 [Thermomicrobiales bacterium]|jgi:hypothetical protein